MGWLQKNKGNISAILVEFVGHSKPYWDCGMAPEKLRKYFNSISGIVGSLEKKVPVFFSACGFVGLWDGSRKIKETFQQY